MRLSMGFGVGAVGGERLVRADQEIFWTDKVFGFGRVDGEFRYSCQGRH